MPMRLVNWLVTTAYGMTVPASGPTARDAYVRRCATSDIPSSVPSAVAEVLPRHATAPARMTACCWRLFDGDTHAEDPGLIVDDLAIKITDSLRPHLSPTDSDTNHGWC
ncbi:hypothetical protein ACVMYR_28015 [Micromonospora sp. PTRAS2]